MISSLQLSASTLHMIIIFQTNISKLDTSHASSNFEPYNPNRINNIHTNGTVTIKLTPYIIERTLLRRIKPFKKVRCKTRVFSYLKGSLVQFKMPKSVRPLSYLSVAREAGCVIGQSCLYDGSRSHIFWDLQQGNMSHDACLMEHVSILFANLYGRSHKF